ARQPANTAAGAVMPEVAVAITDSLGHILTSATDTVSVVTACVSSACGDAWPLRTPSTALSGTVRINAVQGVAHFRDLVVWKATSGYALMAWSGSLRSVSAPFEITRAPGPFTLTGQMTAAR